MTAMRQRAALFCASLCFAATPALANGRFPLSQRFFQEQGNPDHLRISATFGLLLSQDAGLNWYHVCEGELTPELLESDPLFEVLPDGSMLAALVRPLRRSTDCGCEWEPVLGDGMDQSIVDIAKAGESTVLALARTSGPPIVFRLERSTDGGRTWNKLSDLPQKIQAHTLDAAPSDPTRVYVSAILSPDADAGIAMSTPALFVSEDGGATWSAPRPIQGATFDDQPYIAAVHPTDADTVYVRSDAWTPNDETGLDQANDALFVTDDAGMQFREVVRKSAKLFGFALSPDASKVLVGYGDPVQATRDVYPEDTGIYSADATSLTFTQDLNAPVSCLTWNDNGLFACLDGGVGVSTVGTIPTSPAGFTPILAYADVKGPLACNATTCLPEWQMGREDVPAVCERLAAECEIDPSTNVVDCGGSSGGSGGDGAGGSGAATGGAATGGTATAGSGSSVGGTSSGAGGSATGGAGTAGARTTDGSDDSDDDDEGSCGCRSPGATGGSGAFAAVVALALLAVRKRARSRRHSDYD